MRKVGPSAASRTAGRSIANGRAVRSAAAIGGSKCTSAPIDPARLAADSKCTTAPTGSAAAAEPGHRPLLPGPRAPDSRASRCARGGSSSWPSMTRDFRPSGFTRTCAASRGPRGSATTVCGGSSSGWERCEPLPFRRMECEPGQEAQVDFGTGATVLSFRRQAAQARTCFRVVLVTFAQGL